MKLSPGPKTFLLSALALLIGCLAGVAGTWTVMTHVAEQEPLAEPLPPSAEEPEPTADSSSEAASGLYYPPGYMVATELRMDYGSGSMELHIPRLGLTLPVLDDVDDDTLARGIGLFREAQLPEAMEVNSNTSIAGHRDVCGMEFYSIDLLETGDSIYLKWNGIVFRYEVAEQFVTHDADWSPIHVREYPCVTIQSCEPIGVADKRIFTVARMVEAAPGDRFP